MVPDVLPTEISVKSVMSDKSSGIDTPGAVVSSMEVAGRSPPAEIEISESPEVLQKNDIRNGSGVRKVDGEVCH